MSLKQEEDTRPKVQYYYWAVLPQFCYTCSFSDFVLTWMSLALFPPSFSSSFSLVSKHCSEHSWAVASLSPACGSKMFIWIKNTLFQETLPPLLLLNSAAGEPELISVFWDHNNCLTMSHFFTLISNGLHIRVVTHKKMMSPLNQASSYLFLSPLWCLRAFT